jgi:flagellar biogenesis protein FliO
MGRIVVVGLGFLAIVAGFSLPQFWQSAPSMRESGTTRGQESKSSLEYTPPQRPEIPDAGALLLRLGTGSVLVLGLCVGTLWMGRRWLGGGLVENKRGGNHLQIVEALPLGGRCLIYLIRAEDHQILAGVDQSGLKALLTLPESFEAALNSPPLREGAAAKTDANMIVPTSGHRK